MSRLSGISDRALLIGVGAAVLLSAALLFYVMRDGVVAAGFVAFGVLATALIFLARKLFPETQSLKIDQDWTLFRQASEGLPIALALTDRTGRLVCANDRYEQIFGGAIAPSALSLTADQLAQIAVAGKLAWKDGQGATSNIISSGSSYDVRVSRAGRADSHLVWQFKPTTQFDDVADIRQLINGTAGQRLGEAGIMAVMIDPGGKILAASPEFILRSTGSENRSIEERDFASLMEMDSQNAIRFAHEGKIGNPLRLMQISVDPSVQESPMFIMIVDELEQKAGAGAAGVSVTSGMQTLMAKLPLGMALADRDGRFIYLNDAFCRAVGVETGSKPVYPGDIVVREDKAAVADAVRKHANGPRSNADMAIRLVSQPEDPVALTIAGVRGLGEAAVLLSIKDSSEESRLKKQVAQQTKMQAVGQLAGGVAHDFNNILTAIIGHCDLMMMRHTPGDSDYDDIQQIKNNSNRAASLTRQLLAFSRQQTLRPQVLQLPDVVSEISNLLKRLMGETVQLEVNHGRNLGPVRADPGQLEQVIVNLAVNARDAMTRGGKLIIKTFAVDEAESRKLGDDIMPPGDYTALSVTDTGHGIPAELLPKIFEPFFTTKDVGKGTGLGLSTVYGIVKQSGGYIFAESTQGQGTVFSIYLPVHISAPEEVAPEKPAKDKATELWGSGLILLVEDEDMVRAVAERALTRHGYQVITATNGEEGLEMLAANPGVALIITDVVMPLMDGPTMASQARALHPNIPILFMSGYAEEQLRKSISLENVNFLPKPFSVQQLAEAARGARPIDV